jgi:hypothetical protein
MKRAMAARVTRAAVIWEKRAGRPRVVGEMRRKSVTTIVMKMAGRRVIQ